jgi:hypothetical protein
MERDEARIQRSPSDPDPAFDFIVTAEHVLDWLYPGKAGEPQRRAERDKSQLLQLVSHIATGAKHMVPEAKRHTSVERTETPEPSPYGAGPYGAGPYGGGPLVVHLDSAVAAELGYTSITVLGLANRVLEFWRAHPAFRSSAG